MFTESLSAYLRVIYVGVATYAWLILVLRVSGKRSLAKLNAFDFAVTVAFGSVLASVLTSKDADWMTGAIALLLLALLQYLVTKLSIYSRWFEDVVRSQPALLLKDGKPLKAAMEKERITAHELEAAVRSSGFGRLDQVAAVVIETDGSLSVIGQDKAPVDLADGLRFASNESPPE